MVWPTLESRTAKEQNRRQPGFIFWYTLFCIGIHAPLDLLVHNLPFYSVFSVQCFCTGKSVSELATFCVVRDVKVTLTYSVKLDFI